jgi:hypothetical protein
VLKRSIGATSIFIVLFLMSLACGSLSPPEDCGEGIGGTADEALFGQNFSSMNLLDADTGGQGKDGGENGRLFDAGVSLKLAFNSKSNVTMRICIQERKGGGKVVLNRSVDYFVGEGGLVLGKFRNGDYVVRVIMGNVLVKNLPFGIE